MAPTPAQLAAIKKIQAAKGGGPAEVKCPACGKQEPASAKTCPDCGKPMPAKPASGGGGNPFAKSGDLSLAVPVGPRERSPSNVRGHSGLCPSQV